MAKQHLIFKEDYKGWVSFLTYSPDLFATLGNNFYTIKNGQVWKHNDNNNPNRNNFYNNFHEFKLRFFVNIEGNEDVIFKTTSIEGNDTWNMNLQTNYTQGSLSKSEFNKRESYYYAHFRKNELEQDLNGLKAEGIGILKNTENQKLFFDYIPGEINNGDKLFCSSNENTPNIYIGEITNVGPDYLEISNLQNTIITNAFYFATKDSRVEGGDLRGYYADITITNDNKNSVELFAINTNVIKSYV